MRARAGGRGAARGMGVGTLDWMSGDFFWGGGWNGMCVGLRVGIVVLELSVVCSSREVAG